MYNRISVYFVLSLKFLPQPFIPEEPGQKSQSAPNYYELCSVNIIANLHA